MKLSKLLVIAGIGVSCLGAYWVGSWGGSQWNNPDAKPRKQAIGGLTVDTACLDLGEVWEEKAFRYELPIENSTLREIEITDFIVSCSCLAVEPRKLTIPPRETATIRLKLDFTHRTQREIGQKERALAVKVTPILKTGEPPGAGWYLTGLIKSRVTLDSLAVNFGESPVQDQPPVLRTVIATTHVPVAGLTAKADASRATVRIQRRTNFPEQFEIVIAPQPTLRVGRFQFEVALELTTPEGQILEGVTLPVEGIMQPEIRPLPARILLGSRPIGEMAEAFVVLQAPPETQVIVDHIEVDSEDIHVEPASVEGAAAGRTFRVTQRVTRPGDQTSIVRFTLHKPNQPAKTLSMDVCYRGEVKAIREVEQQRSQDP